MSHATDIDRMRPEYDFSNGIRGKHAKAYGRGASVVTLEPAIAKVFKDSAAVNRALRMLIDLAEAQLSKKPVRASGKRS